MRVTIFHICRKYSRVLVPHLIVHILADLLQDGGADFRKLHLSKLSLREAACTAMLMSVRWVVLEKL